MKNLDESDAAKGSGDCTSKTDVKWCTFRLSEAFQLYKFGTVLEKFQNYMRAMRIDTAVTYLHVLTSGCMAGALYVNNI